MGGGFVLYPVAMTFPCDWPLASALEVCGKDSDYLDEMTDEARETATDMAVEYLYRWTDRQFGLCETTIRPCRRERYASPTFHPARRPWEPVLLAGKWYNITCGRCGDSCGCPGVDVVKLPGPISSVVSVWLGGEPLDVDTYAVLNGDQLVRTEGRAWPNTNDPTAPRTDPDVWEVTYLRGTPVPAAGRVAARLLAIEFAKAICNDRTCQLPSRWRSINRDGISIEALDTFDDMSRGHTGIWAIDSWIESVSTPAAPATVASPDFSMSRGSARTWPTS